MPVWKDATLVRVGVFLILLCVFSLLVFPVLNFASAADQQITAALASIQSSLVDMRAAIQAGRNDERADRSAMLKRTNDWDRKLTDLSARVDGLDVSHVASFDAANAARIAVVETELSDARLARAAAVAQEKAASDALMVWIRPAVLGVFGIVAGIVIQMIFGHFRHKRSEEKLDRVAELSAHTETNTNHLKDELVALTAKASHAEGVKEGRAETS